MDQPPQKTKQGVPQPPPPFSCTHSPNIPELLQQMNISLAISTYQAGKVIMISPKNRDELIQLPRNFQKPMGIAMKGNKMAIATLDEVTILVNDQRLAASYPKQPNTYDAFYLPRMSYFTGQMDMHDLEWGSGGLYGINTQFSCLSLIDDDFNFKPIWKPEFISELVPEDRCHLNGIALKEGIPRYATALGSTNTSSGWREKKATGGVLIDIESNEIILDSLPMPHTPRIYNNELYLLLSGTGELVKVNTETKKYDIIKSLDGFVRGMDLFGDYLFIGLSKLRTSSKAFQDLPVSKKSVFPGIMVIYLPSASLVGYIKYETSVDEIYDVRVIPDSIRPGILSTLRHDHKFGISFPESAYWAVPENDRK